MQDWDRLAMILVGGGVAVHTAYRGWQAWRQRQRQAALGSFLLAVAAAVLPVMLALYGG